MIDYLKRRKMSSYKKYQDLTGLKYGKITVIERAGTFTSINKTTGKKSCRAKWKCVCECGTEVIKNSNELYRNKYTKCRECAYAERPQSVKRYSGIERLFQLKVTNGSNDRQIEVHMTAQEYYDTAKAKCFYCHEVPKAFELYNGKFSKKETLYVNGVDRIDSNLGYSLDNCVACCFDCNKAKSCMSQDAFFNKVEKIYNIHIKDKK